MRSQAWKIAYWLALYAFGLAVSARVDWGGLLGLPSRALGLLLIALAFALSASAGRHLRLYGKSRPGGFGQIDRLVTVGIYSSGGPRTTRASRSSRSGWPSPWTPSRTS